MVRTYVRLTLVLATLGVVWMIARMPGRSESEREADIVAAYEFAEGYPQIVSRLPCFCGCVVHAHSSLKSCFISQTHEKRTRNPHGRT